ncbi:hypothetical protein [Nitrospirillum bahiense]|uniref:Uncharacterized protein n=1 Tax=Nitrospirillum amazonense TaxID=28077 RepID=A0A560FC80_9PROT|nr:hypothetical protein [Nitrospirillum amazonense]TWB19213.1 hypothetical protein FBZ88_12268 [Nitrospirillum amazonense]
MSKVRIRAALACRIAGLDRVKFNDAVSNGSYPCAPHTMKGSARLFHEEDLLPLYFFARLTDLGLPASVAGPMSCQIATESRLENAKHNDRITFVKGVYGSFFTAPTARLLNGEVKIQYDPDHTKNGTHYPGVGPVLFTIDFYVNHVRKIIADAIDVERNTFGEEDDAE